MSPSFFHMHNNKYLLAHYFLRMSGTQMSKLVITKKKLDSMEHLKVETTAVRGVDTNTLHAGMHCMVQTSSENVRAGTIKPRQWS